MQVLTASVPANVADEIISLAIADGRIAAHRADTVKSKAP
jgi:hypothetical protein